MKKKALLGILLTICLTFGLAGIVAAQEGPVYPALDGTSWVCSTRVRFLDLSGNRTVRDADVVYVGLNFTYQDDGYIAQESTGDYIGPGATLELWYRGSNTGESPDVTLNMFGAVGFENELFRRPKPYLFLISYHADDDLDFNLASLVATVRYGRDGRINSLRVHRLLLSLDEDLTFAPRWGWRGFGMSIVPGT